METFQRNIRGIGATIALILLSFVFFVSCAGSPQSSSQTADSPEKAQTETAAEKAGKLAKGEDTSSTSSQDGGNKVRAVVPEDVLPKDDLGKGAPERKDWNAPSDAKVVSLPGSDGSSAGAIPAVKPFNFGRDPGGPEDKTLYLTIPKLGLADVPVYNELSEEALKESTVHHPATGFPWQTGANVFIAGHRIGYEGTGSLHIFYDLPSLAAGDEITLTDSAGGQYIYQVTGQETVAPDNVESMNPVEGKSMISLQTCTLPDYTERVIIHGELVQGDTA